MIDMVKKQYLCMAKYILSSPQALAADFEMNQRPRRLRAVITILRNLNFSHAVGYARWVSRR